MEWDFKPDVTLSTPASKPIIAGRTTYGAHDRQKIVREEIHKMLDSGAIRPSLFPLVFRPFVLGA